MSGRPDRPSPSLSVWSARSTSVLLQEPTLRWLHGPPFPPRGAPGGSGSPPSSPVPPDACAIVRLDSPYSLALMQKADRIYRGRVGFLIAHADHDIPERMAA